jgi:hypothetical protein
MTNEGEKPTDKEIQPQIEAPPASSEAKPSIEVTVDTVRELVHNLADANCNGLEITPDMSREDIENSLRLYGYPLSILHPEEPPSSNEGVFSSPRYDTALLKEHNEAWQNSEEKNMREHVVRMNNAGEMVFVEVDGKLAGMIGIRKLGLVKDQQSEDRQLYELPRFSILPGYDETSILRELIKKVQASILKECTNPLILVHTKRPSVREWALRRVHRAITFEEYFRRRNISPNAASELKARWKKEGWEYFEVDPLKRNRAER